MGLISAHGSKAKKYVVYSADGYVLRLHRLMGGAPGARGAWGSRGPVLLQHGMLCGSDAWVLRGAGKDLGMTYRHNIPIALIHNAPRNHLASIFSLFSFKSSSTSCGHLRIVLPVFLTITIL